MANRLAIITVAFTLFSPNPLVAPPQPTPPPAVRRPQAAPRVPTQNTKSGAEGENPAKRQHAHHKEPPPAGSVPETLDPAQFSDDKAAFVAYSIAAKIRDLLYQEPCYCGCDKTLGHESLLTCYTDKHGARCLTCLSEVFFVFEQHKAGKSAAAIREGIDKLDFLKLDLKKYVEAHYVEHKQPAH